MQLVPYASEPEMAKLAPFSAKPQCRYPLHPEKRVVATDNRKSSRPIAMQCSSAPRSTQVKMATVPNQRNAQVDNARQELSQILGESNAKGDEYPNAPLVCA